MGSADVPRPRSASPGLSPDEKAPRRARSPRAFVAAAGLRVSLQLFKRLRASALEAHWRAVSTEPRWKDLLCRRWDNSEPHDKARTPP